MEYTGELIARLIGDYKLAKEIGQNGKETAKEIFSRERYQRDWVNYIINELKISLWKIASAKNVKRRQVKILIPLSP